MQDLTHASRKATKFVDTAPGWLVARRQSLYGTRCVSEHARARLEFRRGWTPAAIETCLQQPVGVRSVLPDGDRRQPAESGGVVDEEHA